MELQHNTVISIGCISGVIYDKIFPEIYEQLISYASTISRFANISVRVFVMIYYTTVIYEFIGLVFRFTKKYTEKFETIIFSLNKQIPNPSKSLSGFRCLLVIFLSLICKIINRCENRRDLDKISWLIHDAKVASLSQL